MAKAKDEVVVVNGVDNAPNVPTGSIASVAPTTKGEFDAFMDDYQTRYPDRYARKMQNPDWVKGIEAQRERLP